MRAAHSDVPNYGAPVLRGQRIDRDACQDGKSIWGLVVRGKR